MRRLRPLSFLPLLGLLLVGPGCPKGTGPSAVGPSALNEAALPSEPAKLILIADENFEQGGRGVENAVVALKKALADGTYAASKDSFEAHWRLSRAYAELCQDDNSDKKALLSKAGIEAGRKAMELSGDRVEGPYFLAQNLGFAAQANKGENKELIAEMVQKSEQAIALDEKYDFGGPSRMLGAVYAKAPAPPLSIGDPEKAVKLLKRAQEIDGSCPANALFLAEALIADERYADAEAALVKARGLLPDKKWDRNRVRWTAELTKIERKLKAKQG